MEEEFKEDINVSVEDINCEIIKEPIDKKPRRLMQKDSSEERAIIDFFLWRAGKTHEKEIDYKEHNLKHKTKRYELQQEVFKKIKKLSPNVNATRLRKHFNNLLDDGTIIMNKESGLFVINLTPFDDMPELKIATELVLGCDDLTRSLFGGIENARVGDGNLMENFKGILENATPLIIKGKEAFEKLEDGMGKETIKKQKDNPQIINLAKALGLSPK